jgi:hypothetical protein
MAIVEIKIETVEPFADGQAFGATPSRTIPPQTVRSTGGTGVETCEVRVMRGCGNSSRQLFDRMCRHINATDKQT